MEVVNTNEFNIRKFYFAEAIKTGVVFIYPTDTIYGIGCSALLEQSVAKIRRLKGRWKKPFSVIAPSKQWIRKNCELNEERNKWLKKLPGPYTLILKTKKNCVSKNVTLGQSALGIRIPNHWISEFVSEIKIPIVTTSVNKSGNEFMTSLEELDDSIKNRIDFIIYEGEKKGKPSTIIDLTGKPKIMQR